MMENDAFNMPNNMADQNPIIMDGIFSNATSVSLAQFNSVDLNNQNQIISGFPMPSMLQGEPINDLHGDLHLENHSRIANSNTLVPRNTLLGRNAMRDPSVSSSYPISNTEVQDRFMSGMPISAGSLATLFAARYGPHENLNDIATSVPSAHPVEVVRPFVSNDYSDTLRSSFGTSVNFGYDGILGDMNNKWDLDKFLAPPELAGTVPGRTGFQPFQSMRNMDPNGWISSENTSVSSDSPSGSSRFSNELSLSLATCQPAVICGTTMPDQCSEISYSGVSSHSLNERRLGLANTSCNSKNLSLSFGSYKPVQLLQLLSGSRYLHVMQEILAEIASYSSENLDQMSYAARKILAGPNRAGRSYTAMGSDDFPGGSDRFEVQVDPMLRAREAEANKKHLLDLLQMVDDRYNQWMDEIHTVISAFHAVTELDPRIHTRFALQTISFLYKNLRERITSHILAMGVHFNRGGAMEEETPFETSFVQKQWALQQLRKKDHQLWRPQRGLPERSVSVLRAWMFQNFLHPYPKDAEKHLLAVKSGLTRSQVSNWFINARVRLWKPMIEEMYAEMNRRRGRRNDEETDGNRRNHISINGQRIIMN